MLDSPASGMAGGWTFSPQHNMTTGPKQTIVNSLRTVVEDGSVSQLRQQGGVFDEMWKLQAEGLTVNGVLQDGRRSPHCLQEGKGGPASSPPTLKAARQAGFMAHAEQPRAVKTVASTSAPV
ncbi:hypothetical protein [Candidatus Phyllobacterium onerii]|uniref:hypothetical protein n=1 Tax=Candidatus Phyllobacterium onerii TaxID=3020828 RepID=UPI00232CDE00|nr:hypothetical protein [Phyllobacterium sp. IY22]